jgi:hypothetical protein
VFYICVSTVCFQAFVPLMWFTFVFLLFVSRLLFLWCVLHLLFYCLFHKCKPYQRNTSLKTNSRNTNVKHIRGTKAWPLMWFTFVFLLFVFRLFVPLMCFTFVFLLFVSRLLFLWCVLHLCFYCLETNSRNTNVKHIRGTKSLKTNSRNTNVNHIRGTKAWKKTVETQM